MVRSLTTQDIQQKHSEIIQSLHSIADFIRWGASQLNAAKVYFGHGTDNAIDEATLLILHTLQLPVDLADTYLHTRLLPTEKQAIVEILQQRIETRRPAAYLTQQAWFMGLPFFVDERVLVPRSPFAELIEQQFTPWLNEPEQVMTILDLGTGSGCIGIACAYAFTHAQVDLVDISDKALAVAQHNIDQHGLQDRVSVVQSDLFKSLVGRRYDLIVSNPPYVSLEALAQLPPEYQCEPELGLAAGEQGLDSVLEILRCAPEHLNENGWLVVEVGMSEQALISAMPAMPFIWPELQRGGEGIFMLSAEQLASYG